MDKTVLRIEDLTVESFTVSEANQEMVGPGIVDTGCMSDCASGCGFGGYGC
jgi:hypothetical protein